MAEQKSANPHGVHESCFIVRPDQEIVLCFEGEVRFWEREGIVAIADGALAVFEGEKMVFAAERLLPGILEKIRDQGRLSVVLVDGNGLSALNECVVVTASGNHTPEPPDHP